MEATKQFEEIQVCPHCNAEAKESPTWELTFCSGGCGCIEGDPNKYAFRCPDCEEICDEPKCSCHSVDVN